MTEDLQTGKELILSPGRSMFFDIAKYEHAKKIGTLLSGSSMVPDQFRGSQNLGNCIIALNLAERMEVDPFMLMQNMYIVHGRPGIEAKLAIALVNGSKKFTPLQFKFEGTGKARQCTCYATHKETKEVCSQTVTWEMVEAEGWNKDKTNRTTGEVIKSKWNTLTDIMFQYRSAMFFTRIYCPEVTMGFHSVEEILDMTANGDGVYRTAYGRPEGPVVDLNEKLNATGQTTGTTYATKEPPKPEEKKTEGEGQEEEKDPIRAQYNKLKTTGFKAWVEKHAKYIPSLEEKYRTEIRDKWMKLLPHLSYPLDEPEEPPAGGPEDAIVPEIPPQESIGATSVEDEEQRVLRLVEGSKRDSWGKLSVPCSNREGHHVYYANTCPKCELRIGCPTFAAYDKDIASGE